MIKRFKTFLKEELSDKQKLGFEKYASLRGINIHDNTNAINLSKHIIPEGTDSIKIPIKNSLFSEVHDHILKSGFHGMDYEKGVAYKEFTDKMGNKKRQETNIGKVLNTNLDLKNRYDNDNKQQTAHLQNNYDVIISRNPYHIASCSTNPDNPKMWDSCASLTDEGLPERPNLAASHLPHDIQEGTHVAYLVPKNDQLSHTKLIDKATARILLKPFSSDNNHTVLRPETRTYSHDDKTPDGFLETVQNFAETHFPLHSDEIYHKHANVYDDDKGKIITKIDLKKPLPYQLHSLPYDNFASMIKAQTIHPDDITDFLKNGKNIHSDYKYKDILSALPHNRGFNESHINHFINHGLINEVDPDTILSHKKFNNQHFNNYFNTALNYHDSDDPNHSIQPLNNLISYSYKKLTPQHVSQIVDKFVDPKQKDNPDNDYYHYRIVENLLGKNKLNDTHLNKLLNANNPDIMSALSTKDWSFDKNGDHVLNKLTSFHTNDSATRSVIRHQILDHNTTLAPHHITNLLNDPDIKMGDLYTILQNHPVNGHHIHKIIDIATNNYHDTHNYRVLSKLGLKKEFNLEHFNKLRNMEFFDSKNVYDDILKGHTFTPEETAKILPTLSSEEKGKLAANPHLTDAHVTHLLNDPDINQNPNILHSISNLKNLSSDNIHKLIDTKNYGINHNVLTFNNSNLTKEHLDKLIDNVKEFPFMGKSFMFPDLLKHKKISQEQRDKIKHLTNTL